MMIRRVLNKIRHRQKQYRKTRIFRVLVSAYAFCTVTFCRLESGEMDSASTVWTFNLIVFNVIRRYSRGIKASK